ncbi:fructose-bisphosphate aldolase [Mesorhizobium tianshanense]|uniref:L-fuculose-phosphate aldolase n=1 Tax=Mesorhizobium tianshanense TaxID=39844 RepID=A0A562P2Q6_9HYPH|nr:class II aldolase/adducin family protein [Mesorhizobium tianshanense]TWI38752.1 L-fuculose-phosphate aldolase [Mesorhizobium tianshanense]GLS36686.1 fructose-bisphosphate aldolase [Mesorhizobium tianshanense]
MHEIETRQAIVDAMQRLEALGFNRGTAGNVSCRIAGGMLVTPTGGNSTNVDVNQIVHMSNDHRVVGSGFPSSEWHMHAAILAALPSVCAVIHTHADACVALSCLRQDLPAFHYTVAAFGGDNVRCSRYATFGTMALAAAAVEALEGRTACLLANHGMIAVGPTLAAAMNNTIRLETLARQYLLARQAGEPALLPPDEMARIRERYLTYGKGLLKP